MKRTILLLLITAFSFASAVNAEEIIVKGELVTLERAILTGLKRHPAVLAGKGSVAVGEARKGQAEAGYWPTLEAAAGYSWYDPAGAKTGSLALSTQSYWQYSGSASARQVMYDFGKTATNVNLQRQNLEAAKADLLTSEEQIILNVKQAYYNHLRAKRNRTVAAETVHQFQQHLEQARAFYEVGTKPRFDVTKAEVDLSNARLNLIRAENAVRITLVALNNAMGLPEAPEYTIEDNLSFSKFAVTLEEAVKKAYDNRPELKALAARRNAAEQAISVAEKGYLPLLAGNASWSWAGRTLDVDNSAWTAGMTLSIPIFSGFLTRNQVSEAKANLSIIIANEETLRQNVLLEVQQNFLNMNESEERIVSAELVVRQARENHEIATGRYAAGVGNPIEVTDAEVALNNAKAAHIQALYDYKVAAASLEKAIGTR